MQNWDGLRYRRNEDGTVSFFDPEKGGRCVMNMSNESFLLFSEAIPNPSPKRLLQKVAQITALTAACSCARQGPIDIDVTGQPDWAVKSLVEAADFWALQDVEVNLVEDQDAIKLRVVEPAEIPGNNAQWFSVFNTIKLSNKYGSRSEHGTCALAHEIGHVLGMDHVEASRSLMTAPLSRPREGCYWSVDDQIELCRVTGCTEEPES